MRKKISSLIKGRQVENLNNTTCLVYNFYRRMKYRVTGNDVRIAYFSGLNTIDDMIHCLDCSRIPENIVIANKDIFNGVSLSRLMYASQCFRWLSAKKIGYYLRKYPQVFDMYMKGGYVEAGPEDKMSKDEAMFMIGLNAFSEFFFETCIPVNSK